ncbi:putative CDP-alcohol phosphatidyltransferase class-I family protein [Teratosphaeria destructans]|uniref:CDP-alcohol phosphatidyltransferase class-I family protein n=1 Tax=Teratosphaeria destructans TaxID=418781 RepID=A0A9W7W3D2_9PEZI|nr:putative CDP-alcohol phosphatidyltransferase class-I family protein [Teratosphaeria destructans]
MAKLVRSRTPASLQHVTAFRPSLAAWCQSAAAVQTSRRLGRRDAPAINSRISILHVPRGRPAGLSHSGCASVFVAQRRRFSNGSGEEPGPRKPLSGVPNEKSSNRRPRIAQRIEDAKERTKAVRQKVRSSLTNLSSRENIYTLPNFLTVTRLVAAPVCAYLLVHDQYTWALGLFAYAGITDLVDGWMARKWKLQTVAGSVMDPMADKALMIILTVTLAVKGALPLYLATLILGRDASLAAAAIYYRYASLPAPKTFTRYWDFSLPSAVVHPTTVSKYNTFLQLVLIGSTLALPVVSAGGQSTAMFHSLGFQSLDLHQLMLYYQWLVAATTAWSGLSYAFLKNAVTILGTNEELKARQGARGRAIIGVTFGGVVAAAVYIASTVDDEQRRSKEIEREKQGVKRQVE